MIMKINTHIFDLITFSLNKKYSKNIHLFVDNFSWNTLYFETTTPGIELVSSKY